MSCGAAGASEGEREGVGRGVVDYSRVFVWRAAVRPGGGLEGLEGGDSGRGDGDYIGGGGVRLFWSGGRLDCEGRVPPEPSAGF